MFKDSVTIHAVLNWYENILISSNAGLLYLL